MLPNKKRYDVQISNVSMSGIHFEIIGDENVLIINDRSDINIGDYARISFRLDDTHKSKIDRMIVIRRIQDKDIGAEFCDNIADKKLGFYLMP